MTPENCTDFLNAGCCCVGVGSNLADRKVIACGDFEKITSNAREYVRNIRENAL